MAEEYESRSAASEVHAKDASESDGASEEFTVLNVSKREVEKARTDLDSTRSEKNGDTRSEGNKLESLACENKEALGGSKLAEWIVSVRKGANYSEGRNHSFTKMIRKNKNFHNPAIFEKMISYCKIDEFGTRFTDRNRNNFV